MSLLERLTYLYYRLASSLSGRKGLFTGTRWPRLLVLDFSYEGVSGHHHALNTLIVSASEQAGLPAHVLANRRIDPSLVNDHVHAFFSRGTYGAVATVAQARKKQARITRSLFREMLQAGLHHLPHSTTVLVHTANAAHVLALTSFLKLARHTGPACIYLMLPPDFDASSQAAQTVQKQHYTETFEVAKAIPGIRFLCENRLLQTAYKEMGCSHVDLLDLPCELPGHAFAKSQVDRLEFLFIGDPRPEKGLDLIVQALPLLNQMGDMRERIRIKLLLTRPQKAQEIAAALAGHEFAQLHTQPFFSERDYFEAMGEAHCVLLPYAPQAYRLKNSNMVSEALGCGTPVIVPPGPNSLSDHCKATGMQVYVEMAQYMPQGLADAIAACLAQAPALQANAAQLRPRIIEARHPRRFIAEITRAAHQASHQAG